MQPPDARENSAVWRKDTLSFPQHTDGWSLGTTFLVVGIDDILLHVKQL